MVIFTHPCQRWCSNRGAPPAAVGDVAMHYFIYESSDLHYLGNSDRDVGLLLTG
jgi:hypothetical protein